MHIYAHTFAAADTRYVLLFWGILVEGNIEWRPVLNIVHSPLCLSNMKLNQNVEILNIFSIVRLCFLKKWHTTSIAFPMNLCFYSFVFIKHFCNCSCSSCDILCFSDNFVNKSSSRQYARRFSDSIVKSIFNIGVTRFIFNCTFPNDSVNNERALVQMIGWHLTGTSPEKVISRRKIDKTLRNVSKTKGRHDETSTDLNDKKYVKIQYWFAVDFSKNPAAFVLRYVDVIEW